MIMIGGAISSVILYMAVFAAIHFRNRRFPEELQPTKTYETFFWLRAFAIAAAGIYAIAKLLCEVGLRERLFIAA